LWSPDAANAGSRAGLSFNLVVEPGPDVAVQRLGLGQTEAATPAKRSKGGRSELTVGGAMHWDSWSLGGSYARGQVLGTDMDLMGANFGYGRLSAGIAYGQSTDYQTTQKDVLLLSTDLAAWSWLTLESDVAVGTDKQTESSVAAGRVGFRLNF
jgi:hypothetical protein